jgi:hypothetical protein
VGEIRNAYKILVGRSGRKIPLGRPIRIWEDNIKTDLKEIRYGNVDWSYLTQNSDQWLAFVNTIMCLRVP